MIQRTICFLIACVWTTTLLAAGFSETRMKAEKSESPLVAMSLWQQYVDSNPPAGDLEKGKKELDTWKKRVDENAEKINGKWIGGEDRQKILDRVEALYGEASQLMQTNQTLAAVKKFEEIIKIYPNSFAANFWMGFINLTQDKFDASVKNLEMAVKLQPESPEAHTNYAIALSQKKQHINAVLEAYKATELRDSKEIVQNLVNSIASAPPGLTKNPKVKPAVEAASLLAGKYGINGPGRWWYVGLRDVAPEAGEERAEGGERRGRPNLPAGVFGNGSGLIVSDDGLILTNKHVAGAADMLLVRMADGSQVPAEKVVVDEEQDLALIRIKSNKKLPFLQLSLPDTPNPGAECTALGFPLGNVLKLTLQVTPGTVSSVIKSDSADIVVTCKVNPGNSGGPLVDKFGNVIGVVTQKTFANEVIESYGKAISAAKIRSFLDKHQPKHKAKFAAAEESTNALSTEEIYRKVSPAAVCIIMIRGETK